MPDKRELTKKQREAIKEQLRIGIAKIESGAEKEPYLARPGFLKHKAVYGKKHPKAGQKNPKAGEYILDENGNKKRASSATGKYQFLKSWLSIESGPTLGIKQFAKKQGVFGEVNSMEDFRQNPDLQEAYFSYYADTVLIDNALKITDNPLNLSFPEMASQFHFQAPGVARRGITSGNLTGATDTNVSGLKYVKVFRDAVGKAGLKPITNEVLVSEKEKAKVPLAPSEKIIKKKTEQTKEDLIARDKAISSNEYLTPGGKEKKRKELYQEALDNGLADVMDEYITEENEAKQQALLDLQELVEFAEKTNVKYQETWDPKTDRPGKPNLQDFTVSNQWQKEDREQFDKMLKKHDLEGRKKGHMDPQKIFSAINKSYEGVTGKPIDSEKEQELKQNPWMFAHQLRDQVVGEVGGRYGTMEFTDFDNITLTPRQLIDRSRLKQKEIVTPEEEAEAEIIKKATEEQKPKTAKEEEEAEFQNAGTEYFDQQRGMNEVSTAGKDFSYGDTKQDLPIDAITGMALGLIGNNQADRAKIPLRTEEVSDALKSYAAELSKRSFDGLPVEIEAKMKNDLANAFQSGLQNIVNASGGNSATVLGNLGSLESSKSKGLVAIQVADYQAKEKAFEQYGQALMYMNDFDSRRDIANHEIEYTEAQRRKSEGRALATAGFSKMIEGIKDQKQNGPGSANDMYRSLLMQKMFGFDPKKKDDGTGKPGTQSRFKMDQAFNLAKQKKGNDLEKRFLGLNPEQRKAANQFIASNQDSTKIEKFVDYLVENPDLDTSKISMDNLDLAVKNDNYGLLSEKRERALLRGKEQTVSSPSILPQQNIANSNPAILEKVPEMNLQNQGVLDPNIVEGFNGTGPTAPISFDGNGPSTPEGFVAKEQEILPQPLPHFDENPLFKN